MENPSLDHNRLHLAHRRSHIQSTTLAGKTRGIVSTLFAESPDGTRIA
jgi:hypothetical protein